jgi:uncharacterized membrane protein affecting hemolysin expression
MDKCNCEEKPDWFFLIVIIVLPLIIIFVVSFGNAYFAAKMENVQQNQVVVQDSKSWIATEQEDGTIILKRIQEIKEIKEIEEIEEPKEEIK